MPSPRVPQQRGTFLGGFQQGYGWGTDQNRKGLETAEMVAAHEKRVGLETAIEDYQRELANPVADDVAPDVIDPAAQAAYDTEMQAGGDELYGSTALAAMGAGEAAGQKFEKQETALAAKKEAGPAFVPASQRRLDARNRIIQYSGGNTSLAENMYLSTIQENSRASIGLLGIDGSASPENAAKVVNRLDNISRLAGGGTAGAETVENPDGSVTVLLNGKPVTPTQMQAFQQAATDPIALAETLKEADRYNQEWKLTEEAHNKNIEKITQDISASKSSVEDQKEALRQGWAGLGLDVRRIELLEDQLGFEKDQWEIQSEEVVSKTILQLARADNELFSSTTLSAQERKDIRGGNLKVATAASEAGDLADTPAFINSGPVTVSMLANRIADANAAAGGKNTARNSELMVLAAADIENFRISSGGKGGSPEFDYHLTDEGVWVGKFGADEAGNGGEIVVLPDNMIRDIAMNDPKFDKSSLTNAALSGTKGEATSGPGSSAGGGQGQGQGTAALDEYHRRRKLLGEDTSGNARYSPEGGTALSGERVYGVGNPYPAVREALGGQGGAATEPQRQAALQTLDKNLLRTMGADKPKIKSEVAALKKKHRPDVAPKTRKRGGAKARENIGLPDSLDAYNKGLDAIAARYGLTVEELERVIQ